MKKIGALVLLVSIALRSAATAADPKSVLADLGTVLTNARSLHSEQKLKLACSIKLSELVGLSKKTILDALGNPDLNEYVVSRDADRFSLLHYYLRPDGIAVTFTVGDNNFVTSVSCA